MFKGIAKHIIIIIFIVVFVSLGLSLLGNERQKNSDAIKASQAQQTTKQACINESLRLYNQPREQFCTCYSHGIRKSHGSDRSYVWSLEFGTPIIADNRGEQVARGCIGYDTNLRTLGQ